MGNTFDIIIAQADLGNLVRTEEDIEHPIHLAGAEGHRGSTWAPMWAARTTPQVLHPTLPVAPQPLVARLAADPKTTTKLGEVHSFLLGQKEVEIALLKNLLGRSE
jgi:hypothetical protein